MAAQRQPGLVTSAIPPSKEATARQMGVLTAKASTLVASRTFCSKGRPSDGDPTTTSGQYEKSTASRNQSRQSRTYHGGRNRLSSRRDVTQPRSSPNFSVRQTQRSVQVLEHRPPSIWAI